MKKTQIKDSFRNIKKQIVSFISIIVIAMLGVSTFLGVDFSARSIQTNFSTVYNELNFRDIETVSTLLFTKDDLACILSTDGVADAEAVRYIDAKAEFSGTREKVSVISLTERINKTVAVEGRAPVNAGECAVESQLADVLDSKIGDTITLTDSSGDKVKYLCYSEYVITGIIKHPDHSNSVAPDTPYVFVTWDGFNDTELEGCFMKADIVIDKPVDSDRFSKSYIENVDKITKAIDELAVTRAANRDKYLHDSAQSEIDDNKKKLDDAKTELDNARKLLDDNTKELKNGETELNDAENKLANAKPLLDDAWIKLESARLQLEIGRQTLDSEKVKIDEGKAELDTADKKLFNAKKKLDDGFDQLEDAKDEIRTLIKEAYEKAFKEDSDKELLHWAKKRKADTDSPAETAMYLWITENIRLDLNRPLEETFSAIAYSESIPEDLLVALYTAVTKETAPRKGDDYDMEAVRKGIVEYASSKAEGYKLLADACKKWDEGHSEYIDGLSQYREGYAKYEAGLEQFNAAEKQYADGLTEYENGLSEYQEQKSKYDQGMLDVEDGKKKLEEAGTKLADGEAEYQKGLLEYLDGESKLADAQKELDELEKCSWISFDVSGNASYVQTNVGTKNFSSLKMTFALLFVLVGALVIFATVGKMIDEQRNLVGTTKALGFFKSEIFAKYLIFGVTGTVAGTVLGAVISYFLIEPYILSGFNKYYYFDMSKCGFFITSAVIAAVAGVILAIIAVWFACARLLREPATRLMQPKTPGTKKKYGTGRGKSLYSRLIMLNMRTDLKRVSVTIVSVAGCCALIIIGFTLRSSMKNSPDIQYGNITKYDLCVKFDPEASSDAESDIESVLSSAGASFTDVYDINATYKITNLQLAEVVCGDIRQIQEYHDLNGVATGKPLYATNEGVLIQTRIAEIYGLDVDSEFEIALGGTRTAKVRVAGVFENYVGRLIVMSRGYYETLYGEPAKSNAFFVRLNGADADKLTEKLHSVKGFDSVTRADAEKSFIETSSSMIDSMVLFFIFIAAIMAGVVLMNLTNMYFLQKKRELTIMRVNGFSVKEVINYVLRETYITTVSGIVLGIALGTGISYSIVRALEQPFIKFDRSPNFISWIIAAALTILFTVIVNVISLRKVKKLKLTDAAN